MNYHTFATRKEANQQIAKMRGWDARPCRLYLPHDANANRNGNVWVIRCRGLGSNSDWLYLRADGYVR